MTAKKRTLFNLDDKVIEITQGKKGLVAKELTVDEAFEASVFDEGAEKFFENDIGRLANEAYKELQQGFKNKLVENVLKIAGFENRWSSHGWEVDHCNGRTSMITSYISNKVQQMITTEIDKVITPADLEVVLKQTKKGLLKDIEERFSRACSEELYKQVHAAAKDFVAAAVKKSMTKHQKAVIEKAERAFLGRQASPDEDNAE